MPRRRRSIRLPGYDYGQPGWYFLTVCAQDREHLFGEVVDGQVRLNAGGRIVYSCISALPRHFARVSVDTFVVMPDHVHLIVGLRDDTVVSPGARRGQAPMPTRRGEASVPAGTASPKATWSDNTAVESESADASPLPSSTIIPAGTVPGSIGAIVQNLKSVTARRINRLRGTPGVRVWQRNYWERVIRNEAEHERLRRYILDNPLDWQEHDPGFP